MANGEQAQEHLQSLLGSLIREHLLWVCKSHVSYDEKVEVAGLVSVTVDSDPKTIAVKFSHTIQRDQSPALPQSPSTCGDAHDELLARNGNGDGVMKMLDRRALECLCASEPTHTKPVGAQKRKSKYNDSRHLETSAKRGRAVSQALDLSKRRNSQSSSEADWRARQVDLEVDCDNLHAEDDDDVEGKGSRPPTGHSASENATDIFQTSGGRAQRAVVQRSPQEAGTPRGVQQFLDDEAASQANSVHSGASRVSSRRDSLAAAPSSASSSLRAAGCTLPVRADQLAQSEDGGAGKAALANGLVSQMALAMQMNVPFLKSPLLVASSSAAALEFAAGGGGHANVNAVSAVTPECHICHTQFESLPALAVHYDDEHKYIICQYCGKSFSTRQNLRRHERLHTGQRPYVCTVCNQGFYRRDAMMSHMGRSHTDRPGSGYQCTVCRTPSTTYNDKFTFRNHMQKKHGVPDVIFCNECVLAFGDKQAYRDHKAQVHSDSQALQAETPVANGNGDAVLKSHGKLPFNDDELLRAAQQPNPLLQAASAMHNTQAFLKQLGELSSAAALHFPQDMPRLLPPFCPPFAFPHLPTMFPRAVPGAHTQRLTLPLAGLPLFQGHAELPALPGMLNPALLEQLKMNPAVLEKLIAEMKDKCAAMRDDGNEPLALNVTEEAVAGENNNEKLHSAKASPIKRE